jgi:hypothetical protein
MQAEGAGEARSFLAAGEAVAQADKMVTILPVRLRLFMRELIMGMRFLQEEMEPMVGAAEVVESLLPE